MYTPQKRYYLLHAYFIHIPLSSKYISINVIYLLLFSFFLFAFDIFFFPALHNIYWFHFFFLLLFLNECFCISYSSYFNHISRTRFHLTSSNQKQQKNEEKTHTNCIHIPFTEINRM